MSTSFALENTTKRARTTHISSGRPWQSIHQVGRRRHYSRWHSLVSTGIVLYRQHFVAASILGLILGGGGGSFGASSRPTCCAHRSLAAERFLVRSAASLAASTPASAMLAAAALSPGWQHELPPGLVAVTLAETT